jgi:hypothetical protein
MEQVMAVKADKQERPLNVIAQEIRAKWPTLATAGYAAAPYVEAMQGLDKITDTYYADSGEYVVRYFLANASSWRGKDAQRIKAELRAMLA